MKLVLVIPELGADNFGHHNDLVAAVSSIQSGIQTQVLTNATRMGSAIEIPWFTHGKDVDGSSEVFFEEMRQFLQAEPSTRSVCIFAYNCDRSRMNQLIVLASLFPEFTFIANLLFPYDGKRQRWQGVKPTNVLLTSEVDATLTILRSDYPGIKSEKMPVYAPQLDRAERAVGLKEFEPHSQLLLFGSNNPRRGYSLALKAISNRKDLLKLVASITVKVESHVKKDEIVRMTNEGSPTLGESTIRFVEGQVDDLALSKIFESSSVAILPYTSSQFRYQASGMFIHALKFNVIPIVLDGTWMAHELRWLGLGKLVANDSAQSLERVLEYVLTNQTAVRTEIEGASHLIRARYDRQTFLDFLSSLDGRFEKQTN